MKFWTGLRWTAFAVFVAIVLTSCIGADRSGSTEPTRAAPEIVR
jgi:hypothetical protein